MDLTEHIAENCNISACKIKHGTRDSNIELFRIITMLLIVAHHYVVNSGLKTAGGPIYSDPISWRSLFLLIFGAFGKTGINCFVLITGYFMCRSQITEKKFFKLLFEVEFYSIVIWFLFLLTGYDPFPFKSLINALLPVTAISTGFTSCYLVFFLFIPFLNILITNMNEKQHIKLLLLCSFMYIFIGTIPKLDVRMNYVSWFIVLYFIGSYIRLYDKAIFSRTSFWGFCTLAILLISIMSILGMTWLGIRLDKKSISYWFLSDSNKFFAVILAVSAFMFFKNLRMNNSKIINTIAASTFGVLLIHANSDTMRRWLWKDVFNNVGAYGSTWMVFHAIGSVVTIYAVCTVIDFLRIQFIEKPFFRFWDSHWEQAKEKYLRYGEKICRKLNIQ